MRLAYYLPLKALFCNLNVHLKIHCHTMHIKNIPQLFVRHRMASTLQICFLCLSISVEHASVWALLHTINEVNESGLCMCTLVTANHTLEAAIEAAVEARVPVVASGSCCN